MATSFSWDPNNLACINTWAFLRGLGQFNNVFSTAGSLQMNELAFWSDLATPELRSANARMVASQLDRIFAKALLAKYEVGSERIVAIDAMTEVLIVKAKTVVALAETVDDNYNFRGELR